MLLPVYVKRCVLLCKVMYWNRLGCRLAYSTACIPSRRVMIPPGMMESRVVRAELNDFVIVMDAIWADDDSNLVCALPGWLSKGVIFDLSAAKDEVC